MTDNNSTSVCYEQFLEFIVPRSKKKITSQYVSKMKQSQSTATSYDSMLGFAKLCECEIDMMLKVQKKLAKFKSSEALDLQMTQLFQCLDLKGTGLLNKKQLTGLLKSREEVDNESDVKALIRRMDADGDNAISFSDYFTCMLPYFIFAESKS